MFVSLNSRLESNKEEREHHGGGFRRRHAASRRPLGSSTFICNTYMRITIHIIATQCIYELYNTYMRFATYTIAIQYIYAP